MLTSQPSMGSPVQSANPSAHDATRQIEPEQSAVALGSLHALAHAPQWLGSVRTLVSQPFFGSSSQLASPSAQVGVQTPLAQSPLMQSAGVTHFWSAAHLGQSGPPQSTSLSLAFCTRSSQAGGAHTSTRHTPAAQSVPIAHRLPT